VARPPRRKPSLIEFLWDPAQAATALESGLTIATRNTKAFAGTGVKLVNPFDWSAA
jgi:hypothetical protein